MLLTAAGSGLTLGWSVSGSSRILGGVLFMARDDEVRLRDGEYQRPSQGC